MIDATIDAIEETCKKVYAQMIQGVAKAYEAAETYRYHYQENVKELRKNVGK